MYINAEDVEVIGDELGEGKFSVVCHGTFKGEQVALKVFKNPSIDIIPAVEKETEMMMPLNHPNIVTCYGYTVKSKQYMIVMKDGGITLDEYIKREYNSNKLNVKSVIQDLLQICQAICYLCSHCISHGDISLKNILVDKERIIRLCDLGSAKRHPQRDGLTEGILEVDPVYTPIFGAPERLGNIKRYPVIDVYSFGMVALSFFKNGSPFTEEELRTYINKTGQADQYRFLRDVHDGLRPSIPLDIPEKLRSLISDCLVFDGYNSSTREETWRQGIFEVEHRLRTILRELSQ